MAPRARDPNPPPEMRPHILDAALRAFADGGYEGTSMRAIAERARVTPGLIYHYFPGKEALLLALFERSMGLVMESFAAAAPEPDPRLRLATLLRASTGLVRQHLDFWRLSYGVRTQHAVVAGLGERITTWNVIIRGGMEALLTELALPSPDIEATLLFAAFDGVCQHFVLDPEHYPFEAVVESLIRHFTPPVVVPAPSSPGAAT